MVFALIVLGLAFGALFAAFLPLITALIAIGTGYSITGLLSHAFSVASFATILGVLIGLGVGVDYALFIVTRHRTGVKGGRSIEDAAVNAVNTAGRAVFFAGITVCIALLGQFALGISFLYGIAVSAAITVALTMVASLTLLPALLGFLGMKVLSRRQRAAMRETGPVAEEVTGLWRRWALDDRAPSRAARRRGPGRGGGPRPSVLQPPPGARRCRQRSVGHARPARPTTSWPRASDPVSTDRSSWWPSSPRRPTSPPSSP